MPREKPVKQAILVQEVTRATEAILGRGVIREGQETVVHRAARAHRERRGILASRETLGSAAQMAPQGRRETVVPPEALECRGSLARLAKTAHRDSVAQRPTTARTAQTVLKAPRGHRVPRDGARTVYLGQRAMWVKRVCKDKRASVVHQDYRAQQVHPVLRATRGYKGSEVQTATRATREHWDKMVRMARGAMWVLQVWWAPRGLKAPPAHAAQRVRTTAGRYASCVQPFGSYGEKA